MTETKSKMRILKVLGLVLLMLCALCTVVNATSVSKEDLQNAVNLIPDKMNLEITEIDYLKSGKAVEEQVVSLLKEKNVNTQGMNIVAENANFDGTEDPIHKVYLMISNSDNTLEESKTIDVVYNNTNSYNSSDKSSVEQIIDNKIKNAKVSEYFIVDFSSIKSTNELDTVCFDAVAKYFEDLVNDKSIEMTFNTRSYGTDFLGISGASGELHIFKNKVYYTDVSLFETLNIEELYVVPSITIPSSVEDNETANINYAITQIKKVYKENTTLTLKIDKDKLYNVYANNEKVGQVVLEREPKKEETKPVAISNTDADTKIKLDTTSAVVPEGTTLVAEKITSGDNYNVVIKAVEKDVDKFVLYDISLVNNNATIQPNGKVKVSIPVPSGYDASKIVVYRVAEDGTKTKLDVTVKDGYITFETDHFSNYVVGEEKTNTTTEEKSTETTDTSKSSNTTKRELDNTPKTGTDANVLTVISSIISLISAGAIALVKKS